MTSAGDLSRLLGAAVPPLWPPPEVAEALPWFQERLRESGDAPWYCWYAIEVATAPETLIGGSGFLGPADNEGAVEIGYFVLPAWRGRGYACEMIRGLAEWAFSHREVRRIRAVTEKANAASAAALSRCGFSARGVLEGNLLFELPRSA